MGDDLLQSASTLKAEKGSRQFWKKHMAMRAHLRERCATVHAVFPPALCRPSTGRARSRVHERAVFKYDALLEASGMQERLSKTAGVLCGSEHHHGWVGVAPVHL